MEDIIWKMPLSQVYSVMASLDKPIPDHNERKILKKQMEKIHGTNGNSEE